MVNNMRRLLQSESFQYTVMSIIASGINFITVILFGKLFSVEDYGIIAMLQALLTNIAVFMTPLQIMICKCIAFNGDSERRDAGSIFKMYFLINGIEIILMLCGAGVIGRYLHFSSGVETISFCFLVLANNLFVLLSGVVQGMQKFVILGIGGILLYLIKLIVVVPLAWISWGPLAVILAFLVAEIVVDVFFGCQSKINRIHIRSFREWIGTFDHKIMKNYVETLLLYVLVSMYMNGGDILLGSVLGNETEIGLYSTAVNFAKISVFLIATPMASLLLPKVSACIDDEKAKKKKLISAVEITFFISAIYALSYSLLGKWMIVLLYGETYAGAAAYVVNCAVFSTVLGVFWVFSQYIFSSGRLLLFSMVSFVCGITLVFLVMIIRCGIGSIPLLMAFVMILTVTLYFLAMRLDKRCHLLK